MIRHWKWLLTAAIVCVAGVSLYFALQWQTGVGAKQRLQYARQLVAAERSAEALEMVDARRRAGPLDADWRSLEVEALTATGAAVELRKRFYTHPELFAQQERAALLTARALLGADDQAAYQRLCSQWEGRAQRSADWFLLEVDCLLRKGARRQAQKLLASRKFPGKNDVGRLFRLAMLSAEQPKQAWQRLAEAYAIDPRNPTIRSFRAQLLEADGRRSAARLEYVAAYLADPNNPALADQLAEFYRRCGNYAAALETWQSIPPARTTDFIALKRRFWTRVTTPDTERPAPAPPGQWKALADFLDRLPPDRFWDEAAFQELAGSASLGKQRNEVFWLQLLQLLQDRREADALRLLVETGLNSSSAFSNDLPRGLKIVLHFRLHGSLDAQGVLHEGPQRDDSRHQFFDLLDRLHDLQLRQRERFKMPSDVAALLRSDSAIAVVFMTGGWTEAAVRLKGRAPLPANAPPWAAYGMTQAMRLNRGVSPALAYAGQQAPSPLLNLLLGELHLAKGDRQAAENALQSLAQTSDPQGARAAWLLATDHLEHSEVDRAAARLEGNSVLAASTVGKELRAQIALHQGDPARADAIYAAIENESIEAAAHRAQVAFENGNLAEAERRTRALLQRMPDNLQLHQNLQQIVSARKQLGG